MINVTESSVKKNSRTIYKIMLENDLHVSTYKCQYFIIDNLFIFLWRVCRENQEFFYYKVKIL